MESLLTRQCPNQAVLQRFLHEKLADDEDALIESHVSSCSKCLDVIEGLAGQNSFGKRLRAEAGDWCVAVQSKLATVIGKRGSTDRGHRAIEEDSLSMGPETIADFSILGELGRGAYGIVYHGYDEALDRAVAIKVPHGSTIDAVGGIEPYLKEAQTLAQLDHPHIVRVYEARATDDGSCYLASQFIDGLSLAERLEDGPFEPDKAVRLIILLADALQHAHERGIYHRDVKPANILLDAAQTPWLADFGLALKEDEVGCGPQVLGTPAYMSPEQAQGHSHLVDGRTDLFSLGIVFYKMLTGHRPFQARSTKGLLNEIVNAEPPLVRSSNSAVSCDLEAVVQRCLEKKPQDRYDTAADLADDLRRLQQGITVAARPVCRVTRLWRHWRRRPLIPTLTAGIVMLVTALFAAMMPTSAAESNTIRVAIKPWIGFSPLVVAAELGLCEDVPIELVPVRNTTDIRQRILSREIDVGPSLVDSHALARATRTPAKVILQLDTSLTADAMIAAADILSFDDLRGKRVAYMHHEAPHFLLLSLCELHSLPTDSFEHVLAETAKEAVDLFVAGKADAVVSYEPFLSAALDQPGAHRLASAADDRGAIIDILTVHEEFLDSDRDKVESLIAAWFKALELLEQRDPQALKIACRFLGTKDKPLTIQEYDLMVQGMQYAGIEENKQFFRVRADGRTEFHDRMNAAQDRWDRHHQLARRTDPREGDASNVFLNIFGP